MKFYPMILVFLSFCLGITCGTNAENEETVGTNNEEGKTPTEADLQNEWPEPGNDNVWFVGNYRYMMSQRMMGDNGINAIVEDQRIGPMGFIFAAQREDAISGANDQMMMSGEAPERKADSLKLEDLQQNQGIRVQGGITSEEIEAWRYENNPDGGKPRSGKNEAVGYTYFLAENDYEKCAPPQAMIEGENKVLIEFDGSCLLKTVEKVQVKFLTSDDQVLAETNVDLVPELQTLTLEVPNAKKVEDKAKALVIYDLEEYDGDFSYVPEDPVLPMVNIGYYIQWPIFPME